MQIRYFLEPSAVSEPTASEPGKLLVPPAQSINKIGHALGVLDPVFRRYTLGHDKVKQAAKDIGVHESPRVLQSMVICKQPKIGGKGKSWWFELSSPADRPSTDAQRLDFPVHQPTKRRWRVDRPGGMHTRERMPSTWTA